MPQFEFKKPTLVVNYPKFQNSTFSVGQFTLKAPDMHHIPEPQKPAPAKSFKVEEKLHLDVKISTSAETGDVPMISLDFPVKPEQPVVAPVRKRSVRKAAPKGFRPAKTRKLQVKVTSAIQTGDAPEKEPPRKGGPAPEKKKGK